MRPMLPLIFTILFASITAAEDRLKTAIGQRLRSPTELEYVYYVEFLRSYEDFCERLLGGDKRARAQCVSQLKHTLREAWGSRRNFSNEDATRFLSQQLQRDPFSRDAPSRLRTIKSYGAFQLALVRCVRDDLRDDVFAAYHEFEDKHRSYNTLHTHVAIATSYLASRTTALKPSLATPIRRTTPKRESTATPAELVQMKLDKRRDVMKTTQLAVYKNVNAVMGFRVADLSRTKADLQQLADALHPLAVALIEQHARLTQATKLYGVEHAKAAPLFLKEAKARRQKAKTVSSHFAMMYIKQAEVLERLAADSSSHVKLLSPAYAELAKVHGFIKESEVFLRDMRPFLAMLPAHKQVDEEILEELKQYIGGFEELRALLDRLHNEVLQDPPQTETA